MSGRLLVITPWREPGCSCGLADHAHRLTEELQRHGWSTAIRDVEALTEPPRGPLLLQFTPYAYSHLGLPLPLLLSLLRWRLRARGRFCPLVVFFHEVPFLNRADWKGRSGWKVRLVMPLQRLCCLLLAAFSSEVLVNQPSALAWLGLLRPFRPPLLLPCWSNVGEAADAPPPLQRPLQVAVFGSPGKRRHAHALVARLGGYRRLFGPEVRVVDIGALGELPAALGGEVSVLGELSDEAVRETLLQSRFGWFYAEPDQVPKSGVFAAYCALGVVPILAFPCSTPGPSFLAPCEFTGRSPSADRLRKVWLSGRAWFQQHSLACGTARILPLISPA